MCICLCVCAVRGAMALEYLCMCVRVCVVLLLLFGRSLLVKRATTELSTDRDGLNRQAQTDGRTE